MKRLLLLLLFCASAFGQDFGSNSGFYNPANVNITGGTIALTGSGATTGNFPISLTYSNSATASGNNNFLSSIITLNQSATSSTVTSAVLGQVTYTGAAATGFDSTGHMIGTFGFAIMNSSGSTIPLMFGAEGKVQVVAGTVTNAAAVQAGLADNTGTIGTYVGVNSQITANHGAITTLKGFDFGITQSALVPNVFPYNGQDVSSAQATNAGTFRSQMTAATAHYSAFFDGGAQSATSGAWYIGALTDNGTGAKLQVTGQGTIGNLLLGASALTLTTGALGMGKMTASASAPGAGGSKFEVVCGTNAGSAKLTMLAGTSATPVTVVDNVGSGVTGC